MQRIIAGRFRGRKLLAIPEGVRPTGSRMRGAIFDRLQHEVRDAIVLDLFAGSGALGLEALSRGAAHTTFVDRASSVVKRLKRQIEVLQLEPAQSEVVHEDAARWILRAPPQRFDLVFVDPPFAEVELRRGIVQAVVDSGCGRPGGCIVVERDAKRDPELPPLPNVEEVVSRVYGDCAVDFLTLRGGPNSR